MLQNGFTYTFSLFIMRNALKPVKLDTLQGVGK